MNTVADVYNERAVQLSETIMSKYWDSSRGLFSDTPEKKYFSQHANALAILTGLVDHDEVTDLANKLFTDKTLTPASIYFKYYLHQALVKAGLGNDYLNWLDKWRENIAMGLTTWAESSDISTARSDCHAWGASPNIEFYRTVLGIDTDAPGFSKVRIEPHPGNLKSISGSLPHHLGNITARYILEKGKWNFEITLPDGLTGSFIWKNNSYPLIQGINKYQF
jgi:hypothetical protein